MSMKLTDLYKNQMLKVAGQVQKGGRADPRGQGTVTNRKEQRKLDQAAGLVPFACKLPAALLAELNAQAVARKLGMNELVAALLKKGLA